jgi:hypothetical protein
VSTLDRTQQLAAVAQAGRAPSPHNIQPARWRFAGDSIELLEDTTRWLAVGDPAGRDNQASLGMAWEGMSLALSQLGLRLAQAEMPAADYPSGAKLRLVARASLVEGAAPDPLAGAVAGRRSFRGAFAQPQGDFAARFDREAARHECLMVLEERADIAERYDAAALEGLRMPGFAAELYRWMRFSASDPRAARDGLSADCLALSRVEALAASLALRPGSLKLLLRVGLGGLLVSEAAKVKSAARIVLVHADRQASNFDAGRRWYRAWLALSAAGAAGVPMSALCDSPSHAAELARRLPLGRRLVNVMRMGPAGGAVAESARLPAQELLIGP